MEDYYEKFGFPSAEKFYTKLKPIMSSITMKEVKDFVKNQEVNEMTEEYHKPKYFSNVVAKYASDIYEIDIIVYDRFINI